MSFKTHISGLEFLKFRLDKNLSQSQLAAILGVSVVTLKSWEHERRNIPRSINNFIRLSLQAVPPEKLAMIAERLSQQSSI